MAISSEDRIELLLLAVKATAPNAEPSEVLRRADYFCRWFEGEKADHFGKLQRMDK